MSNRPEYVITSDGRFLKRPLSLIVPGEFEVRPDPTILKILSRNVSKQVKKAFLVDDTNCNLSFAGDDYVYSTVRLDHLKISATICAVENFVCPSFQAQGQFIPLVWFPPPDMQLYLVTEMMPLDKVPWYFNRVFLFAVLVNTPHVYRLPLPNLYADAKVCMGQVEHYVHGTIAGIARQVFEDFNKSQWNADLLNRDATVLVNAQKLFRWKPLTDSFEQLPPEGYWSGLSYKIGTDILNHMIQ